MRDVARTPIAVFAVAAVAMFAVAVTSSDALAQSKQPAPAKQAAPPPAPAPAAKQIALTEKQIESVLASQKDFDAIDDQDKPTDKPSANMLGKLDEVSKKYGFADYADYTIVLDNIGLVIGGFDPKTKSYVGADVVIKQQIAAVQANKKMPAADRKEALQELNQALKSPPPAVENKGNIELVAKYYDKLAALMQDDE